MFPRRSISIFFLASGLARGTASPPSESSSATEQLDPFVVTSRLDQARQAILPELGATSYRIDADQIQNVSQGGDAPFNQILLRAPGVAEDSAANGDLHVRGEHANLQYRINDVLLPEGISGFGLELDTRFISSVQLITGSLPAQYGFRTAGIVDITTKSGGLNPGGAVSLYGGSYQTVRPSVEAGASSGNLTVYADASSDRNQLGIENPTPEATALHDRSDQSKAFILVTDVLDSTSRISFLGSASESKFQVPDTAGLAPGTSPNGQQWLPGAFDSTTLNENQRETNDYGVIAFQKAAGDLNYQLSGFARDSGVHFTADPVGDLYFKGVASDVDRTLTSLGLQGDASYSLGMANTLRGGVFLLDESVRSNSTTTVFPVDNVGNPLGPAYPIGDNQRLRGQFAGLYLQNEWHLTPQLTVNYGARFDRFSASFDREDQISPRLNWVYQPTASTNIHLGYARYFTPPPVENVSAKTLAKFDTTSNAAPTDQDTSVRAERSNYFDAGLNQEINSRFQVGIDGYYKRATNQLDDGLFGQTLILSAFNYGQAKVYGVEVSTSYTNGAFAAYGNLARSEAWGKQWDSAQFLFDSADFAYLQNHWIHLDHDQSLSASVGAAYHWSESSGSTRVYADAIIGSGLRTSAVATDGSKIPNGGTVPSHATLNLGAEKTFQLDSRRSLILRIDLVNLTDKTYELRDGSGVGVNAPQFGARRGIFGSTKYAF